MNETVTDINPVISARAGKMEYSFDGYSSHYSSKSGVEEEDPTPKPLRITKRAEWPSAEDTSGFPSTISHTHKALSLRTVPDATLQRDVSMVRLRHSSEISSRASSTDYAASINGDPQIILDRPRSPAAASRHRAAGALTVRKQRQRGTTSSSAGTSSTAADGLRGNLLSYPPVDLTTRDLQQWDRDRAPQRSNISREKPAERARRICNRAVTERTYQKPELSHSSVQHKNTFATSASTPFLLEDKARAASEETPRLNPTPSLDSLHTENELVEEGSTKNSSLNRFLSRVMNGLGHKGATSQGATERGRSRKDSHGSFRSRREPLNGAHQGRARSSTTSSGETTTTMGTEFDLDVALAAFPPPPKSTFKSPSATFATPSTPGTSPLTPSTPFLPQTLCAPEEVTIMGAKLTIMPEIGDMNNDGGQSIFAAVGVEGVMNSPVHSSFGSSDYRRLDVAVVIDNSLFSSPAALMSACEIATYLSSNLDLTADRLAILCTSGAHADESSPQLLLPLGPVNPRKAKYIVDCIETSKHRNKPNATALQSSLEMAKDILMEPQGDVVSRASWTPVTGHIFLLTANLIGLPSWLLKDDKLQIHVVHPGSVPWKSQEDIKVNGWRFWTMPFLRGSQTGSARKDESLPSNDLPALIAHARLGKSPGALSDLVLEVKAGPSCTIEAVMGRSTFSSLHAGEKILALVKLRIGTIPMIASAMSDAASVITSPSSDDLLQELDIMLGEAPTPILTAKLRYKHSLLPADAHVSVKTEARLKGHTSQSEARRSPSNPQPPGRNNRQIEVQKHLVFYLATHHAPRDALTTLREQFGDGGKRSVCPEYIKLVAEELRYQAHIIDRFELDDTTVPENHPTPTKSPYSHFGEGLFDVENYKPQDWITIPEEISRPITAINRQASSTVRSQAPKETDEARRIWGDLRRTSRGRTGFESLGVGGGRKVIIRTKSEEEKMKKLQEMALRNKRSVGTDSLKSFAGQRSRGGGVAVAPWM